MKSRLLALCLISTAAAVPAVAQNSPTAARPAASPLTRAVYVQRLDTAFVSVDTNRDGFADRTEMAEAERKAIAQRKTQALKEREAAFRRLDANRDGTLTLQEFNAIAAALPAPKPNPVPLMTKLDTNKDGKVSLAENRVPSLAQFDRADRNRDGTLSAEERQVRAR